MTELATGYRGATAEHIQHHYDLSNDFYALWLDPSLTYSCALWDGDDDTLEAAQMRKLDYLANGMRARGAERILDVGCGWGSMMRRLVDHHDVRHVVGVTLSEAQAEYVDGWADDRLEVRVENWADHDPASRAGGSAPYDGIVSIGAFEHFAQPGLTRAERIDGYRQFFARCREWLPFGGRLALQTISKGNNMRLSRTDVQDSKFVMDTIFPGSELPRAAEVLEASEHRFELVSLRNDAPHYARTTREWLAGLQANRERAVEIAGEQNVANYERYLDISARAFDGRHGGLLRFVFERV
jgi:cyclopropane-fatty-acyl-phospholipid synthase